jgi:hypothetical protein
MTFRSLAVRVTTLALALAPLLTATSCIKPPEPASSTPPPPVPEIGRFQVLVASEGDRGSVVFLVDTKDGATWIYRPPQGTAINGFWSDIPRLTYAPDYWQRVFSQAGQAPAVGAGTIQPSGAPPTPVQPPAPTR